MHKGVEKMTREGPAQIRNLTFDSVVFKVVFKVIKVIKVV